MGMTAELRTKDVAGSRIGLETSVDHLGGVRVLVDDGAVGVGVVRISPADAREFARMLVEAAEEAEA